MRSATVSMLAVFAASAAAFGDTSPFFMWSTAEMTSHCDAQLQSRQEIMEKTEAFLSGCPTDSFVVIGGQEISASDFASPKAAPGLRKALAEKDVKGKMNVAEVVDGVSAQEIVSMIERHCGGAVYRTSSEKDASSGSWSRWAAQKKTPVLVVDHLKSSADSIDDVMAREEEIAANDAITTSYLSTLPRSYTIIFTTTPPLNPTQHTLPYDPEFTAQEPIHIEMKRASTYKGGRPSNQTGVRKNAPLFEKYQFFTPGLFMTLLVSLFLLGILSVAISALGSLKVSYGAFDKEMGPAAQKKQN